VVGVVALAAADSSTVAGMPRWVRAALAPNAWATIALVLLLGGACVLLARLTGRATTGLVGSVVVGATVALAIPVYLHCENGQAPGWTALAWTLSLFLGSVQEPFGSSPSCPAPMPLALQLARLLALAATFLGLGALFVALFADWRDRFRVRWARSLTIVVGLDEEIARLAGQLAATSGETVAVVADGAAPAHVQAVRAAGARFIAGDPRRFLRSRTFRNVRDAVKTVYVLPPDLTEALETVAAVQQVFRRRPDRGPLRIIVRVDDPWQADDWRRLQVNPSSGTLVDTVGPHGSAARSIAAVAAESRYDRIVVVGDSALAAAILDEDTERHTEAATLGPTPALTFLAPEASLLREDHNLRRRRAGRATGGTDRVAFVDEAPDAETVTALLDGGSAPLVVLADHPSREQSRLAERVALRRPDAAVVVREDGVQGLSSSRVMPNLRPLGVSLLTTDPRTGRLELPEDGWVRVARQLHEHYLAQAATPAGVGPSKLPWDELAPFYRESNLRRLAVALEIAVAAGRTWLRPRGADARPCPMTQAEVERYAPVEHESWRRQHLEAGWRPGRRRTERFRWHRRHPELVDWEELSPASRGYTEAGLEQTYRLLEAVGYVPYLTPDWQRYSRTGQVTAVPRDEPWQWQAPSGHLMQAAPGGWQVTGADGVAWSIDGASFARTYEHVGGDTYRRMGTVWVRTGRAGESVLTAEGPETVRDGDVVVRDDEGLTWVVGPSVFATGYVPGRP